MPVTITTADLEVYNGRDMAGEAADGAGLSIDEVYYVLRATGADEVINFDASLAGTSIVMPSADIFTNVTLNGDTNGDGVADITLVGGRLSLAGFNTTPSLTLIDINISFSTNELNFRFAPVFISADNASVTNAGTITAVGGSNDTSPDRVVGVQYTGDNFTLTNEANGVIDSAGRHGVEALFFFDSGDGFAYGPRNATIVNHGLIEGSDDGIRFTEGTITNTGTIRGSGEYDIDANGDRFAPGRLSDGISAGVYDLPPDFQIPFDGLVSISNSDTGLIEGLRAGVFMSAGGVVDNAGIIQGDGYGIIAQPFFERGPGANNVTPYSFTLNNSGTVERFGQSEIFNPYGLTNVAAVTIFANGDFNVATIANTGTIRSSDMAIYSTAALELTNSAGAQILSGQSGNGFTGTAIETMTIDFFQVDVTFVNTSNIGPNRIVLSAQNFTYDAASDSLSVDGATWLVNDIQLALLTTDSPYVILPLVDINASMNAGELVYQTDVDGNVLYPDSIIVPSVQFGDLTVTFFGGGDFIVADAAGAPVFNDIPATLNVDDDIINDGLIEGDINLGLGDDVVVNRGTINGTVDLGRGDDVYVVGAGSSVTSVSGGDGNDILTFTQATTISLADLDPNLYASFESIAGSAFTDTITGDANANVLLGLGGNDTLNGGGGDDVLEGGLGADTLNGGAGNDLASYFLAETGVRIDLNGNLGSTGEAAGDVYISIEGVNGTEFADTFYGLVGSASTLNGNEGDDYFFIDGFDIINGGDGYDRAFANAASGALNIDLAASELEQVRGANQADVLDGSASTVSLILYGNGRADILSGGSAADYINGGGGDDVINGGAGNDILDGLTNADTVNAGAGNDIIYVDHLDTLDGGAGYDRIYVRGYSDGVNFDLGASNIEFAAGNFRDDVFDGSSSTVSVKLLGGAGNDTLTGGSGDDQIFAQTGDDIVSGGAGNDLVRAGAGADSLSGGDGNDIIFIDGEDIFVDGGAGNDRVYANGNSSAITLDLNAANVEYVSGSENGDTFTAAGMTEAVKMLGRGGNDTLVGGEVNDLIFGGAGDDSLNGGGGDDFLFGQGGTDSFVFTAGWGFDRIVDFDTNGETLDFSALGITLADLTITAQGNHTLIEYGADSIFLYSVNAATLDASDFSF